MPGRKLLVTMEHLPASSLAIERVSSTTPPFLVFLTTWSFDPAAAVMLVAAAALYLGGVLSLRRRGHHWPARLTWMYLLLGLGSYAVISFGFLGAAGALDVGVAVPLGVVGHCLPSSAARSFR